MKLREQTKEAFAFCFGERDGDIVLQDLEDRFFVHTPTFSADPYETAFREGQRAVVLYIKNMMSTWEPPQEVSDE